MPCYNEASRLAVEIYLHFLRENAEMDICFVNDGSSDGTDKVLENMQSLCPEPVSYTHLDVYKRQTDTRVLTNAFFIVSYLYISYQFLSWGHIQNSLSAG